MMGMMGMMGMTSSMKRALVALALAVGCGGGSAIRLDESWPQNASDYRDATERWTRRTTMSTDYQEALKVAAVLKSPEWRLARAARDADHRRLTGPARDAVLAQAKADMAGPYEIELLVTTWDRRENDLDRGKRSVWRVVLVDESGTEIEPLEIVKDKRAPYVLRADFPAFGDFATAYIARFPRTAPVLGPTVSAVRLRMSSARGGVELEWAAH